MQHFSDLNLLFIITIIILVKTAYPLYAIYEMPRD
jgi:hypothetical protein